MKGEVGKVAMVLGPYVDQEEIVDHLFDMFVDMVERMDMCEGCENPDKCDMGGPDTLKTLCEGSINAMGELARRLGIVDDLVTKGVEIPGGKT